MAEKKAIKNPEIRFNGFADDWEQRKLSELYEKSSEKNDGSIDVERNITVATMQFKPDVTVSSADYLKTYYTFNVGDIAFEGHHSKDFIFGRFVENDIGDGIVSHIFAVFRPIVDYDLYYWKYAIHNESIMRPILSKSTKASTMMHDLVTKDFLNESILVPSVPEQKKIGDYLSNLENLITLHQRKLDKLKDTKKSCLEKMFPKEGEKVPEIRFGGFSGEWKLRKIEELLEERNIQFPMSTEYPLMAFVAYEGVSPKGERYDRSALVTNTVSKKYKRTEFGDFIYSSNNLETGSIGLNKYGKACISPVYSIFHPTDIADSSFLGNRLVRKDFIKEMVKWRQGAIYGQWRIHESDFIKIEILVPSLEEQRKIGAFLNNLDNLIALQQHKLDKLKDCKKNLLGKMFGGAE